ncbi:MULTISPECIES: hypothetical protein [unclassified Bradyrhizobium]|uniref:hypothetical protein n=1 Tax=unclassified Bradyrhizobium TaxID=2631580 RepID=UPI001BAD1780|nr:MULTISPECIES: hypothetical protein [unclassified Bradyrhizobium]MBR1207396.1 hypothetical protein [Bradyrhizobium sp. AUGA SZCCT0124]MBR1316087.1 hypothetical protein [Bradyrhizobium sp. AUGA SZCCT0051]MBR1342968.1 hypothetical protein [Bradyrhizobium sp. AUGA SZCCT0105]MBR1357612.1 hypothetical protein [Bradyrhizobium sp. AUGA SZCCT0045]
MKAIEQIIAGYVSLKNRQALEQLRDHRQHLLDDVRTHSFPGFRPSVVNETLSEEIELIQGALARFDEGG